MFGLKKFVDPRSKAQAKATGALADFYRISPPASTTPLETLPLLALDCETTGLNAKKDRVLSIGWVPVDGDVIIPGKAQQFIVAKSDGDVESVGQSATIHGITDDDIARGTAPHIVLEALLASLTGRVMLVHFEPIETEFLSALTKAYFGAPLVVPVVDTFALERRHMERMGTFPRGEDLRLARVRSRYNLPRYKSHSAVTDALATAELYQAIRAHQKRGKDLASIT